MESKLKDITESLKAHFLSLYCLTVADNDVDPKELEMLYNIGLEYGITEEEIQRIIMTPNNAMIEPNTLDEKISYLYNLTRIAYADGKIKEEEVELIGRYVLKFGFPVDNKRGIVDYLMQSVRTGKTVEDIIGELR